MGRKSDQAGPAWVDGPGPGLRPRASSAARLVGSSRAFTSSIAAKRFLRRCSSAGSSSALAPRSDATPKCRQGASPGGARKPEPSDHAMKKTAGGVEGARMNQPVVTVTVSIGSTSIRASVSRPFGNPLTASADHRMLSSGQPSAVSPAPGRARSCRGTPGAGGYRAFRRCYSTPALDALLERFQPRKLGLELGA